MSVYDSDVLQWSQHQATLLRHLAAGERLPANESPDWANIIDEVESVGRGELHSVESLLTQAMLHRLKQQAWPQSGSVSHWRREARTFSRQASRRFTPSMRHKLDLNGLYADAVDQLPDWIDDRVPPLPPPGTCPFTLEDLLDHSS